MLPRQIHAAIRLAVATVVLAIAFRTWLVMGLIEPVAVAGSSMAPTLRGPFVVGRCPSCGSQFEVGAEFAASIDHTPCPQCSNREVLLAELPIRRGDRLWIDRTAYHWRAPRRWEVVVAHCPEPDGQLCVKRIVGLPGERIQIRHGDVWANGRVVVKSLAEQHALRRLVSRADDSQQRWSAADGNGWQWRENCWQCLAGSGAHGNWLRYVHPHEQPITDNLAYNAGLSRKLNLVRDFLLSANLRVQGEGTLTLEINGGGQTCQVIIRLNDGFIELIVDEETVLEKMLPTEVCQHLRRKSVRLDFSNFDRRLLLAFDGQVELSYPLEGDATPAGTAHPFAIGVKGLAGTLGDLTLYCDDFHCDQAVGARPQTGETPTQLAEDEFFVLGDNSPISIDSRSWGPISQGLLLGKPIGVR